MPTRTFENKETQYRAWIEANPAGYVLSATRPDPTKYMALHRASCRTISTANSRMGRNPFTGRGYMKICSTEVGSLSEWMKSHGRQSFSTICKICKPEISASETFQSYLIDLEKAVRKSQKASAGRKERLAAAAQKPERFIVATVVFKRNPDVIAEVLDQAKGVCGRCKKPAPFKRVSDKSPYLEVHHLKHLAKGGRDIVANSIAVCPNCHRRYHFG